MSATEGSNTRNNTRSNNSNNNGGTRPSGCLRIRKREVSLRVELNARAKETLQKLRGDDSLRFVSVAIYVILLTSVSLCLASSYLLFLDRLTFRARGLTEKAGAL